MKTYSFNDVEPPKRRTICVCGRPATTQFRVSLREYDRTATSGYGQTRAVLSRPSCESCAVELFLAAKNAVTECLTTNGGQP